MARQSTTTAGERDRRLDSVFLAVCVCLLFTASGTTALVYEVAWKHVFTTVFGSTTYAVSVVISVFMAGLALGSWVFGRAADRMRRHLLTCAVLEVGIGATGLAALSLLGAADGIYRYVYVMSGSPALLTATQVAVCAVVLLPPTILMGGTLPVLSRFLVNRRGQVAGAVGLLYGLNTLGAAAGAFLTGFVLIDAFGTARSVYLAVAANLALAIVFLLMHVLTGEGGRGAAEASAGPGGGEALGPRRRRLLLSMVAVSGFSAFSFEVLWTRLLTFRFESTVYAFSIMLSTFLLGLGLGGAVVGLLGRTRATRRYWRIYGWLEAGVGVTGLLSIFMLFAPGMPNASFAGRAVAQFGACAAVMLVPTTLMGASFPIACHLYARDMRETGRSVGGIYLCNTVGSVLGGLLTGFLLVRTLGTHNSLKLASLLMAAGGAVVLAAAPSGAGTATLRARSLPVAVVAAACAAVLAATPGDLLTRFFERSQATMLGVPDQAVELLDRAEGVEGIVLAVRMPDGERLLSAGATVVAGTGFTLRNTQKLQGHIPMLIHPEPREVCQVGFGSGETAGIFASYEPDRFDVVEISQAVIDMAGESFTDINRGITEDQAFAPIIMDAAAYLRYTDRRYDVIANDATWPHLAGPAMLYTREYFLDGRRCLKDGGIMTSWLPLEMPPRDFKTVLRTFQDVFPVVYVWASLSHQNKHALIIGSERPLQIDATRFLKRFDEFARDDLAGIFLDDPAAFLSCHLSAIDPATLAGVPLNTRDRPVLQFLESRPGEFGADRQVRQTIQSYELLTANRDSISDRLTNVEGTPEPERFLDRVRRMELATDHTLRATLLSVSAPELAVEEARKAQAIAPDHPAGKYGEHKLASALATAAEPRDLPESRYLALMDTLFASDRYAEALPLLEHWVQTRPDSADARLHLGMALLHTGRAGEAVHHCETLVELAPDSVAAHGILAKVYMAVGRVQDGTRHARRAQELSQGGPR